MKKVSLVLLMAFLGLGVNSAFAGGDDIILLPLDSIFIGDNHGRSLDLEPSATFQDGIITLEFLSATNSEVKVTNEWSGIVVYTACFSPSTQVQVNASSFTTGSYRLDIFAFGKWWWGEFTIEEEY